MARQYGASGKRGKKRSTESLKADNAGIKDGTIRKGKGGKTVRKYNAKTGRWEVLRVIDKKGRTKQTSTTTAPSKSNPTSVKDTSGKSTYNPGAKQTASRKPVRGQTRGNGKFRLKGISSKGIGSSVNRGTTGSRRERMQKKR